MLASGVARCRWQGSCWCHQRSHLGVGCLQTWCYLCRVQGQVCREGCATLLCCHLSICSLKPPETPWPEAAEPSWLPWEVLAPLLLALLPDPSKTKPFHRSQRKSRCGCSQSLLPGRARLSPCRSGDDKRLGEWPGCSLLLQFARRTLQPLDDFLIRVASLDCPPHADPSITHS